MASSANLGQHLENYVSDLVKTGRYNSRSEVLREGVRLVEERETRLAVLRETLNAAIAAGGDVSDEDLDAALAAEARSLSGQGF